MNRSLVEMARYSWDTKMVLNVATGMVQIVHTVKFMETAYPDQLMTRLEIDEDEETGEPECQSEFLCPWVPTCDGTSIVEARQQDVTNHDITPDGVHGGTPKKQVVTPSEIRTKHQKVDQARVKADDEQLVIDGGMLMSATKDVPRAYNEATTSDNRAQWKATIECELKSLMTNKTWKLVPRPKHQRAIG
ncbi:unnamed protein product [Phytophthora fragariaefolia]|uniref:Unnamed protein product n=1 Tax=Phytophthora fragariaefolia TaxID=1490495 RepID=A0A9W6Y7U4_9STRA|nr:unnamed protein product [Phytophthora fragariaefolia]